MLEKAGKPFSIFSFHSSNYFYTFFLFSSHWYCLLVVSEAYKWKWVCRCYKIVPNARRIEKIHSVLKPEKFTLLNWSATNYSRSTVLRSTEFLFYVLAGLFTIQFLIREIIKESNRLSAFENVKINTLLLPRSTRRRELECSQNNFNLISFCLKY